MKLRLVKYRKFLFISSLSISSLIFNSVPSFAQDMTDPEDATFSCSSAVNVMDCINQTQAAHLTAADPKSLIINGLNNQSHAITGPVSLNVRYDDQLSWIIDGAYAEKFGNRFAIGLKGSYGPNEYRGNATLGFGITSNQQFKLTYEYLAQNLPFEFTSGNVNEWVNQNAFGGAYRYMFTDNKFLKGVEVSGSYTKANSKNLSLAEGFDNTGDVLERRIAGGQQQNGLASVVVTPFKYTVIKAGAGYSASSFDTKWNSNQSQSTIAYNVEASHLLTPKTLISTSVNNTSASRSHSLKISHILPANLEGELGAQYNISHVDGISNNGNLTVGLSYPAPKTYTNMFSSALGDLKSWVQQPVIYNARVLAVSEEKLHKAGIDAHPIPLQIIPVNTKITELQLGNYFSFDKMVYNRIDYMIDSITDLNGNAVNVDLKLSILNEDNYTAKLYSTDNMPAAAFTPGKYILNLTAKGIRNNMTITQQTNPFEVDVVQNGAIPAANWIKSNLPDAQVGTTYSSGPLSTYLKGIDGETFTFTVKDLSAAPWLHLSQDGQSLVSDGQVNALPTDNLIVSLTATSVQSSKNANPEEQKLTLNVKPQNYKFPTWSNVKLPDAYFNMDYSLYNTNNNTSVILNPYTPFSSVYVVPTQDSNNNAVSDNLKFYVGTSLEATGSNDPNDCSNWLTIANPETSTSAVPLSGVVALRSQIQTSCNAYIKVYSEKFNDTRYLKDPSNTNLYKTINFINPQYMQPDWNGNSFPVGNAGFKAYLNPNIDHTGDGQPYALLTQTKNKVDPNIVVTDPLNNFSIDTSRTTCTNGASIGWLTIVKGNTQDGNDDSYLTGTPPSNISGSCDIYLKFTSSILGSVSTSKANTLYFNSSAPQWIKNGLLTDSDYYNLDLEFQSGQTYNYNISNNLQDHDNANMMNNIAFINPINSETALPSGATATGISITNENPKKVNAVISGSTVVDVVGRGSTYQGSTAHFTVEASMPQTDGSYATSVPGNFYVRIVSDIINPQFKKGVTMPAFKIGENYTDENGQPINLNPYTNPPSPYMDKAKLVDGTEVPNDFNNLTFSIVSDGTSDTTTCEGITISPQGILSWPNPPAIKDSCKLVVNIMDKKNDGAGISRNTSISIPSYNKAPSWTQPTTGLTAQFDAIDVENCVKNEGSNYCINLNNLINSYALTPQLKFNFADGSSDYNYWHIEKAASNNNWYLLRRAIDGKVNAMDVGTADNTINIIASNEFSSSGIPPQNFVVQVNPESDWTYVEPYWTDPSNNTKTVFTVDQNNLAIPLDSYIKLKLKNTGYEILDSWNADEGSSVMTLPDTTSPSSNVYFSSDATSRYIKFDNSIKPINYGTYPNSGAGYNSINLQGFTAHSVATKKTFDISPYVTIYVKGELTWSNFPITPINIYFYQMNADSNAIKLNDLMNIKGNTTLTNVQFKWDNQKPDNWALTNIGNDWYLVRALNKDGALDAGDIANSNLSIGNISMTADGMEESKPASIPVKVLPDPYKVKLHTFIPTSTPTSSSLNDRLDQVWITPRGGQGAYSNYTYMGASDSVVPDQSPANTPVSPKKIWLISCFVQDRSEAGCNIPIVNDMFYHGETNQVSMNPSGACNISNMSGGNGGWSNGFARYISLASDNVTDGFSSSKGAFAVSFNEGDTEAGKFADCSKNGTTTVLLGNNLKFYSRSQGKAGLDGAYQVVDNGIFIEIKNCQNLSPDQRSNYGCSPTSSY